MSDPVDPAVTQNADSECVKRLHATTDAQVWAREFMAVVESGVTPDEGLMIGWFANAMATAERIVLDKHPERKPVMDRDFAVLSREALLTFLGEMALPPWRDSDGNEIGADIDCAAIAGRITDWLTANDLGDLYAHMDGSGACDV